MLEIIWEWTGTETDFLENGRKLTREASEQISEWSQRSSDSFDERRLSFFRKYFLKLMRNFSSKKYYRGESNEFNQKRIYYINTNELVGCRKLNVHMWLFLSASPDTNCSKQTQGEGSTVLKLLCRWSRTSYTFTFSVKQFYTRRHKMSCLQTKKSRFVYVFKLKSITGQIKLCWPKIANF